MGISTVITEQDHEALWLYLDAVGGSLTSIGVNVASGPCPVSPDRVKALSLCGEVVMELRDGETEFFIVEGV